MSDEAPIRPRDFALLLLASGDVMPRQRARDQQADRAGLELKRQILSAIAAQDPEPEDLELTLMDVVEDMGPPTGPTRSVALTVLHEWQTACQTPGWVERLLGEAVQGPHERTEKARSSEGGGKRGGQLPS
jgi:hypothetical protein